MFVSYHNCCLEIVKSTKLCIFQSQSERGLLDLHLYMFIGTCCDGHSRVVSISLKHIGQLPEAMELTLSLFNLFKSKVPCLLCLSQAKRQHCPYRIVETCHHSKAYSNRSCYFTPHLPPTQVAKERTLSPNLYVLILLYLTSFCLLILSYCPESAFLILPHTTPEFSWKNNMGTRKYPSICGQFQTDKIFQNCENVH